MKFLKVSGKRQNLDPILTTKLYSEIIKKKKFLKKVYQDFYSQFVNTVGELNEGVFIELGSGGGFLKDIIPDVITSDILKIDNIDICFSAVNMPLKSKSVKAFFMIDVLHHIEDIYIFFKEIDRCLISDGCVVMVEPSNTLFSHFIYKYLHHEEFDPKGEWKSKIENPLFDANSAMAWIIFHRDREIFKKEFPSLKITRFFSHTPFRYHIVGGISGRQLVPDASYNLIRKIENALSFLNPYIGMFTTIELKKI